MRHPAGMRYLITKGPGILYIVYGCAILIVQVTLIRELLSVFGGNELVIGLVLGCWLFWTAAGSFACGRIRLPGRPLVIPVSITAFILAIIIPATVICARISPAVLNIVPGEIVGIVPIALSAAVLLLPFCFCSGALFPLLSTLHQEIEQTPAGRSVGYVYAIEGMGAMIGGLLAVLLFILKLTNLQIAVCGSVLFLFIAIWVIKPRAGRHRFSLIGIYLLISFLMLFFALSWRLEQWSRLYRWQGHTIVDSQNSMYGSVTVTDLEGQVNFFSNGLLLFSSGDPLTAEESVHFALLQHPEPRSVLLIGGGLGGGIREALKYDSVGRIDIVEIDVLIIEMGLQYMPSDEVPPDMHEVIHYFSVDPRYYLQTTSQAYDAVILNIPDPSNSLLNRLYTRECFQEISRILSPQGVFSFYVTSSENYLNDELAAFLSGMKSTVEAVYPACVIFPGNTAHFFTSLNPEYITDNPDTLAQRLSSRSVQTDYVHPSFFSFRLSTQRLNYFASRLAETPRNRINTDLNPVGFYYAITLWSSYFSHIFRNILLWLENIPFKIPVFGCLLLCCTLPVVFFRRKRPLLFASYAVGLTMISLEMVLILAYQSLNGYIYERVAVIIACFMLGLSAGAFIGLRSRKFKFRTTSILIGMQISAAILPILVIVFLSSAVDSSPGFRSAMTHFGFLLLLLLAGIIGGFHFQLANSLYLDDKISGNRGVIYAVDLLGAAAGIPLICVVFVPLIGIITSCAELAFLNLVAAGVLLFTLRN